MNENVNSILINLVSAPISFGLGMAANKIFNKYKSREPFLKFLGLKFDKEVMMFCSNIQIDPIYQSPIINLLPNNFDYGDMMATLEVNSKLSRKIKEITPFARSKPNNNCKGNIVCIGGPKWNKKTEQLLGELGSPLSFRVGVNGLVEKRKNHTSENVYPCQETTTGGITTITDYGCIICEKKPNQYINIDTFVIVTGYSTFGVLIAARALSKIDKKELKKYNRMLKGQTKFAIYVKGSVILDSNGQVEDIIVEDPNWIPGSDFVAQYSYNY